MWYEHHTSDDEIRSGRGASGFGSRTRCLASVLVQILQEDLHPTPTPCHPGCSTVPQGRLPRYRAIPQGLVRSPSRTGLGRGCSRPLHHPEGCRTSPGKKGADALLTVTTIVDVASVGSSPPTRAAIDATGLESHHA